MQTFIRKFFQSASSAGIILFSCVVLALIIANSPLAESFHRLLHTTIGFETAHVHLRYSTELWINDGLMAIFFLLVGLEIKRELVSGGLATPKQAALPILCAFGGAIVPALIYFFINSGKDTVSGWGIPMATDIAFALALLAMLGDRVPASLKVFLAALAIVDDLIAILVIAIFYSTNLEFAYLAYALGIFGLMLLFNKLGIRSLFFYLIPALFVWYFIHHSGIHATIAGVLTAFTIPIRSADDQESPLVRLEHALLTPVNFLIVPLFALANTAITFTPSMLDGLTSPLGLGIILGLLVGKPIGIFLLSKTATKLKLALLPDGASWQHIIGVGLLAGVGFTMAIFIALLSFTDPALIAEAKFGILVASLISGTAGYVLLRNTPKSPNIIKDIDAVIPQ
ncbi:Na+/H+ antiporter NhaA [Sphingobacterium sp. lm-10]|uniref:Na+/H+ antiporter NhaA n=1 Tax=Sphingobacterium sp. lm-10 TaxID=2944904 RepID=UPI0020201FF4|nr:Na+/H+ antiporter NhaA [Sphingobacterium sp. lm-10]MCL7986431.1 Na+/H+ antiporter NhaA [Sphingobacterium sp. lm-10]